MAWNEFYVHDNGQKERSLSEERTLTFNVDLPSHAVFNPQAGLVNRGDPHPRILGLYADRFTPRFETGESCKVDVTYSTEAAAFNSNPAVSRTSHKRETQFRRVVTKVPVARDTYSRPLGAPATDPKVHEYTIEFFQIGESQRITQRLVTLTQLTPAMEDTIEAQNDTIHLFGNIPRRFEAGDIVQHGPGEWHVLYTWYSDRGTKELKAHVMGEPSYTGTTANEPSVLPNPIEYGSGADKVWYWYPKPTPNLLMASMGFSDPNTYVRSPFHEIHYIIHPLDPPSFVQFMPFRIEANGWQSLPGGPQP